MVDFRVLGPLEVSGPTAAIAVGGRKQRLLLALLLLHADRFVSRAQVEEALWPEDPPPTAGPTVESYVSRLRSLLRRAGAEGEVITSGPAGYRISLHAHRLDSRLFAERADAARDATNRGDREEAFSQAASALALWRGPALADLGDDLRVEVAALEERRLSTLEVLAEAGMACGREREVVTILGPEVARRPAHEHLRALLMLALYRTGRQAESLESYREGRRHLAHELGLEPGPELRELQERILRHDASLAAVSPRQTVPAPANAPEQADEPARSIWHRAHARLAAVGTVALIGGAIAWTVAAGGGGRATAVARPLRGPSVARLDPRTGRPRATAALTAAPTGLAAAAGAIWATSFDDGTVSRLNARTLASTQTIHVGNGPTGITMSPRDVWVALSQDGAVARVDRTTAAVVQHVRVGTDPTAIAADVDGVWVSNTADGTVTKIDPGSGSVLATTGVGAKPRGIAIGAGAVWVAVSGDGVVARLDRHSGHVVDRIRTGGGPALLAPAPDGIWVANELDSTMSLIDPATDTVVLTVAAPATPAGLAATREGVWIAARDGSTLTRIDTSGARHRLQLASPASALALTAGGLLIGETGATADHRGGTLAVRTAFPIGQIAPQDCCDLPPNVRALSYDSLLSFSKLPGSAGVLVPDLALEVPHAQADGRLYTFRLRRGLRYWDGRTVQASDVVRGIERAAASTEIWASYISAIPGAASCPRRSGGCDLSDAVTADDQAQTVTFRLSRPDPEFLDALALTGFAPAPPGTGMTPGTGPYRIVRYLPGRLIVEARNPFFRPWAPAAQPPGFPDRIIVRSGTTARADINSVIHGTADYTSDPPSTPQLADIQLHDPGQLHIVPMPNVDYLFLDTHAPPFDDVRVRRAVNYATDRTALVRLFGGRAAARPACQVTPTGVPGHQSYCPYTRAPSTTGGWHGPDLPRALSLIRASHTQGSRVSVLTMPGSPSDEATGRYFVRLLRRLGFLARLRLLAPRQRDQAITDTRHPAQAGTISWTADFPSPSQWITTQLACGAWKPPAQLNNHAQFCDHPVDRTTQRAAALAPTQPTVANRLWARADRAATDLAPWVPTVNENEMDLLSRRTSNYQYVPTIGVLIDQLWIRTAAPG